MPGAKAPGPATAEPGASNKNMATANRQDMPANIGQNSRPRLDLTQSGGQGPALAFCEEPRREGREEVERVEGAGASRTARKALGYEELLAGDIDAMKRRTRQYAKRQLTWMRKLAGVKTIDVTGREPADVASEIAVAL